MEKKFILRENAQNVRNFQEISNKNRKTVKCGIESISNRNPFFWANLPNEYKLATSLHDFKGALSALRQFLTINSLIKVMKMLFISA